MNHASEGQQIMSQQRQGEQNQFSVPPAHMNTSLSAGYDPQTATRMVMQNASNVSSAPGDQATVAGTNANYTAVRQNEWYRATEDRSTTGQADQQQYYIGQQQSVNAGRPSPARLPHYTTSGGGSTTHSAAIATHIGKSQHISNQQGYTGGATTYPTHIVHDTGFNGPQQHTVTHGHHVSGGQQVTTSESVTRVERGEERLISVTEHVDESRSQVINERVLEHEVRIPKKIIREEVIERMIVVPEKIMREEVVDDVVMVREKVIEVARPTIIEKVIEVPEIEYVEKPVYEHIKKVEERQVPVEVERIVHREKEWEPEYRKNVRRVPVEVFVDEVVYEDTTEYREVKGADTYVRRPVEKVVVEERVSYQDRQLPVPLEAEAHYDFHLNKFKPVYSRVNYPVYLPRFIEVPVPSELMTHEQKQKALQQIAEVDDLTKLAASLCEVETTAATTMQNDLTNLIQSHTTAMAAGSTAHLHQSILDAWKTGNIKIHDSKSNSVSTRPVQVRSVATVPQPLIGSTERQSYTVRGQQSNNYQSISTSNVKQTYAAPTTTTSAIPRENQQPTDSASYRQDVELIKNQVASAATSFQAAYTGNEASYANQEDRPNLLSKVVDQPTDRSYSNLRNVVIPGNSTVGNTSYQYTSSDANKRRDLPSEKRSHYEAFNKTGKSALVR